MAARTWRFADSALKPSLFQPVQLTRFELMITKLGLSEGQIQDSSQLRKWAERNASRYYVPEELLAVWHITVDDSALRLDRNTGFLAKEAQRQCRTV